MRHGGGRFVASVSLANVLNLVFQLIAARRLGPSSYGALGALTAILFVLSVPTSAVASVITERLAGRLHGSDHSVGLSVASLFSRALIWGAGLLAVLLLCAPLLRDFLHLGTTDAALLIALYVVPVTIDLVPRSILRAESRLTQVAAAVVAGAIVRVIALLSLTPAHGVSGAVGATVLGASVTALILLVWMLPYLRNSDRYGSVSVSYKRAWGAVGVFAGYWVLAYGDSFLGRHYLPANQSGLYVAAATAASIALFIASTMTAGVFQKFAVHNGRGPLARKALVQALTANFGLGAFCVVVLSCDPHFFARIIFGTEYENIAAPLILLSISTVGTSMIFVAMQFHLAGKFPRPAASSWFGVIAMVVLIALFHGSIVVIAVIKLLVVVAVASLMLFAAFVRRSNEQDQSVARSMPITSTEADLDLTMVVPYYNPGPKLRSNIENIVAVLNSLDVSYEVIAVSDGATDGSEATLVGLDPNLVKSVVLPVNSGKGQALRIGFTAGRGRYLGFIDADGDVNPKLLEPYLAIVKSYSPDIVLGSKRHPMSEIHYPPIRYVYSWGYQQLVRILFNLRIRDTQVGLKLMKRELLADVLPRMLEKRFAFDLELFVVSKHLGYDQFFEAPITIEHQFTSTVSSSTWIGTMLDTFAIFYRLHLLHYYDAPRTLTSPEIGQPTDEAAG